MGLRQVQAAGDLDPLWPGQSLEPIFCRSFSVTDLAVLSGRDKREWGSRGLGVIDTLSRNSWDRGQLWRSRDGVATAGSGW